MPATLPQLGARVLRKVGVAIVANASSPAPGVAVTNATIADAVLRELGIFVPDSARPTLTATVSQAEIATRALRAVGVDQAGSDGTPLDTATVFTGAQMATLVLQKLEVIASDETPSNADQAAALAAHYNVHAQVAALDIVTWTSDAIPRQAAEWYVVMAASLLAPVFGKAGSPQDYDMALTMLRKLALAGPSGQSLAEAKVAAVHDAVVAQGIVGWLLADIPQWAAEDYVTMTAILLAPVMGYMQDAPSLQVDTAQWDTTLTHIRKGQAVAGAEARALQRVSEVHEELNASNLVTWGLDAIPLAVQDAYVQMVVALMGPDFGKEIDPKLYAMNLARVRRVAMGGPAGQALAQQKVIAAHGSLVAMRLTRWTLHDLPVPAEEPYVQMAAYLLAPEVDVKPDPAWWQWGEMQICRLATLRSDQRPVRVAMY